MIMEYGTTIQKHIVKYASSHYNCQYDDLESEFNFNLEVSLPSRVLECIQSSLCVLGTKAGYRRCRTNRRGAGNNQIYGASGKWSVREWTQCAFDTDPGRLILNRPFF
jgi:hypothetical protein